LSDKSTYIGTMLYKIKFFSREQYMKFLKFFNLLFAFFVCIALEGKTIKLSWAIPDSTHLTFEGCRSLPEEKGTPYYVESFYFDQSVEIKLSNFNTKNFDGDFAGHLWPDTFTWKIRSGVSRGKYFYQLVFLPVRRVADRRIEVVSSFDITWRALPVMAAKEAEALRYSTASVLSTGRWYRVKVTEDGIYRITYAQLKNWGFTDMSKIQVYGNGGGMLPFDTRQPRKDDLARIPIYIEKGSDGVFNEGDYLLFYGRGPHIWTFDTIRRHFYHRKHQYADYNCYFITDGQGPSTQVGKVSYQSHGSSVLEVTTFDDYQFFESDEVNLLHSGAVWYGNVISNQTTRTFTATFPNVDISRPAFVYYDILAVAQSLGTFTFSSGSTVITKNTYNSSSGTYYPVRDTFLVNLSGSSFKLNLTYRNTGSSDALGYVNYIGVNVVRKLAYTGSPLIFRSAATYKAGKTVKYIIDNAGSGLMVWDVTDPTQPAYVETTRENDKLFFYAPSDTLRQFIVFSLQGSFLAVNDAVAVPNQNIHGESVPDMVIVAPVDSGILVQAKRLAAFRKSNDGLDVLVVTTQQVYNEFASGVRDVSAIRDMVKMFYDRNPEKMKYLLLFGKGTYANNVDNPNNYNLIPTYQSAESLAEAGSYVTDDFFGWMNWTRYEWDNLLDIGVGRFPIRNADEAKILVDKLINYVNPQHDGDWKDILTFVADDEDANTHVSQSDQLATMVGNQYPFFQIRKIYLDAYKQTSTSIGDRYPDANAALNNQINTGTLLVNYTGHGSHIQLAHEVIIDVSIIRSWKNTHRLPLFITATCSFSRFDDVDLQSMKTIVSAGEEILLNPMGGGIGLFTTTRLVYASDNFALNRAFFNYVFTKDASGNYMRLGDIMRLAKNDVSYTNINRLNFTLLGDPSMILAYPKHNYICIDSVYADSLLRSDTIRALDQVTVCGHFAKDTGQILPYNGIQYVTIYDKADTLTTLANDPASYPMRFTQWQNIIFRGKVEVRNGKFSFRFPVPKDIRYNMGRGKMVFYASDVYPESYAGVFENFVVGGVSQRQTGDNEGPRIRLFMNDTNFVEGGITDPNPRLLVKLFDENGINATGIGIGHDITAILDDDIRNMVVLNDFYQSDINDFRSGSIVFPYINLPEGEHRIRVSAYDIYNNYAEAYLTFRVIPDNTLKIERVHNYPNPMTDYTYFVIEHNLPNREVSLQIDIYSFTGEKINTLRYSGVFEGYVTPPLRWYRDDGRGNNLAPGLYVYKAIMKDKNGNIAENYGKLLIVR